MLLLQAHLLARGTNGLPAETRDRGAALAKSASYRDGWVQKPTPQVENRSRPEEVRKENRVPHG
jgi:hypothetical protein